MLKYFSLICFITILGAGCSAVKVKRGEDGIHGIPFFVKQATCKQETVWLEPIMTLVFKEEQILKEEKGKIIETKVLRVEAKTLAYSNFNAKDEIKELKEAFAAVGPPTTEKAKKWDAVKALPSYSTVFPPDPANLVFTSNTSALFTYVDYSSPYYINATRPLIGSVDFTTELKDDGTLGKATAKVEDKTLETGLSLLPITEFISERILDSASADAMRTTKEVPKIVSLKIETLAYKHTLSTYKPQSALEEAAKVSVTQNDPERRANMCKPETPLLLSNYANYFYAKDQLQSSGDAPAPKQSKNTVGITGQIVLPEK